MPAVEAEIPEWDKLQSQINIVVGSVRGNAITITQLIKDIFATFGYDLTRAAHVHGYTSILAMLSDMVGYVKVRNTSEGSLVSAVVVAASAHVSAMIQKTKGTTKKNPKPMLARPGYQQPQSSRGRRQGVSSNYVPRVAVFGSSNPLFCASKSQYPVGDSSSRGQPSSSHIYRPAPPYQSPLVRPAFSQDISAQLPSSPQTSSVHTSPYQGFRPVLLSSSSRRSTMLSSLSTELSTIKNSGFEPAPFQGLWPASSSSPALSQSLESTEERTTVHGSTNETFKLLSPFSEKSRRPSSGKVIPAVSIEELNYWREVHLGSKRPVPPPRPSIVKPQGSDKPRILSPSEAVIWKKKTFADYASKVSFKK